MKKRYERENWGPFCRGMYPTTDGHWVCRFSDRPCRRLKENCKYLRSISHLPKHCRECKQLWFWECFMARTEACKLFDPYEK